MIVKRILLLAALAALMVPAGCIFSPEDGGGGGGTVIETLPFAGSPEQLMENFKTVYEGMDYNNYLTVMDDGFRIYLTDDTVLEFGLPRNFFEYAEEVRITERWFSGNSPREGVGGIERITFETYVPIAAWRPSENPDFPGAVEADYTVKFVIQQATTDGAKNLEINGSIRFFLSTEEVEYQGRTRTLYRMVGQIDGTSAGITT